MCTFVWYIPAFLCLDWHCFFIVHDTYGGLLLSLTLVAMLLRSLDLSRDLTVLQGGSMVY